MGTTVTIDWDAWRAQHAEMTFAEQQTFYHWVAEAHPVQQHFSVSDAEAAFTEIPGTVSVVELGGWDGALASWLIPRYSIASWTNYDIVGVPQVCDHPAYSRIVLDDYFWEVRNKADVFVATHTIEHLTGAELDRLLASLDVRFIYLEAPLTAEGQDWRGYPGSHILELGWREVADLLRERGYEAKLVGRESGLWAR